MSTSIKFNAAELRKRLPLLGSVVKKSPVAILQNIRIFTVEALVGASVVSSDAQLVVYFNSQQNVVTGPAVDVLIPFEQLNYLANNAPEAATDILLVVEDDGKSAKLKIGKKHTTVLRVTARTSEWPDPMEEPEAVTAEMTLSVLQKLIERMKFVVPTSIGGTKHTVPHAKAVSDGKVLRFVGTDGKRMLIAEVPADRITIEDDKKNKQPFSSFDIVLPLTALELIGSLESTDGKIAMSVSDTGFYFTTAAEVLTINKHHGDFPQYEQIIPKDMATKVKVAKDELKIAVVLAIPSADQKLPQGVFEIGKDVPLKLFAAHSEPTSADGGMFCKSADDEVDVLEASGPAVDFSLDLSLLKDYLERSEGTIVIGANAPETVVTFEDDGKAGLYQFFQMPTSKSSRETAKKE